MRTRLLAKLLGVACLLGILLGIADPAATEPLATAVTSSDDGADLEGLATVKDDELALNRGGFTWQGVDINLGAEMRTYLNGALVLQTNLSWTPNGATTTQFVSGTLSPADAAQLQAGIMTGAGVSMHVGGQSIYLANGGQTAFIQGPEGAIQNILINRASNISVRQEIDATLDLHNFNPFQQQTVQSRMGDSLNTAVNLGTLGALTH